MLCEILTSEGEINGVADAWRELQGSYGRGLLTDYEPLELWWLKLGKPEGERPFIVTCREGGELIGLLPLAIHDQRGVSVLRLAGHDVFYFPGFLARDKEVFAALWQKVRQSRAYDFAEIKNIQASSSEEEIMKSFAALWEESPLYHRGCAEAACEEPLATYKKSVRHKLRKVEQKIREDKSFSFGMASDASLTKEAMQFFLAQKRAWCREKKKKGVFDKGNVDCFYRAFCDFLASCGKLRLFWLRRDEVLRAMVLAFEDAGTLYIHALTHDPDLRAFRPGYFLCREASLWACRQGLRGTNFMEGGEGYKEEFSTGFNLVRTYVFASSLKGRLFLLALKMKRFAQSLKKGKMAV